MLYDGVGMLLLVSDPQGMHESPWNIDKQFQDKQKVKSLLDNITNNVLNNLNVFTSTASIAEHLDLEHDYIISINIYEAFKVAAVKPKISAPYIDWDYN